MPMQLWATMGGTIAVASLMGLGLGNYVTSPQGRSPADEAMAESVYTGQSQADAAMAAQHGPAVIECRGCGPTLAERRWQADMAGLDADGLITGSSDPVVRDYQAQPMPEDILPEAAPSPIHQLPPQIARFAAGETTADGAQAHDLAPPPPVVATAAEPQL